MEIFQSRGRPQGNINKKDNREFSQFYLPARIFFPATENIYPGEVDPG